MAPQPPPQFGDLVGTVVPLGRERGGAGSPGPGRWCRAGREPVAHGRGKVLAVLGGTRAEPAGDPDLVDDLRRHREVGHGQPLDLPALGEHERARPGGPPVAVVGGSPVRPAVASGRPVTAVVAAPWVQARLQDDGQPGPPAAGYADDVAGSQQRQRPGRFGPPGTGPGAGQVALPDRQAPPQLGVLGEVTLLAAHLGGQVVHDLVVPADLAAHADHAPVGLELGEGRLQQGRGAGPPGPAGQVDGHVVGGPEAGVQRVGTGAGQAGQGAGIQARLPQHDRVALDVDAAAPGAPGQLGVLPRRQVGVRLAVPLVELLDDHGPGRHVDAECQRLRREHRPDQPGGEQFLDDFLEGGQHPGMMGRDPAPQPVQPFAVAQNDQVLGGYFGRAALSGLLDQVRLFRRGQPQARGQALLHCRVTAGPAEDERDRGQQPGGVQAGDHVGPVGRREPARPAAAPAGPAWRLALDPGVALRDPQQLGIDPGMVVVGEQVVEPVPGQHVLPQRHGPVLVHDHRRPAADLIKPVAELLGVAHGRGQGHHADRLGQVDDHFFPDRAARGVGQVVHLVQDDVAEARQRRRSGIQHVAQHLGGHHHHRRLAVDAVVPGEQAHGLVVVPADQVGVLLVGQGLDRRGVEALAALAQRQVHGELADHGLARPGGRGDQHAAARAQRAAGRNLEVIEVEVVELAERREFRVRPPGAGRGIPFRRSAHGVKVRW